MREKVGEESFAKVVYAKKAYEKIISEQLK